MRTTILLPVVALLAPAFLDPIGTCALAQASADGAAAKVAGTQPAAPEFATSTPWTDVLHDEPGDGRIWSVGASWKASFGSDGAVYYPRVGSGESRRLPHRLSPDHVTLGGETLVFARAVEAVRSGDRVELDRGSFTERYDLALESIEQSFVFDSLPRAGDLVLRIPVASELEAVETAAGLEFRSDRGRITYSRAVVVDARGRRTDAATRIEDGAITIRVGADVLAGADLPLVVDPILNAIFPDNTTSDTFSIDAAYDAFHAVWVVAYEQVFSASDHDVFAKMYSATGTLIASASVDVTSNSWVRPRIADLASAHKFLVVAGATAASGGARSIGGRIVQPNGTLLTMDPQISVSGATPGACILPDVGGDSSASAGDWCVVFQRNVSSSDQRISYCRVRPDNNAVGPLDIPPLAGMTDGVPSIAKSRDGGNWLVAFERFSFGTQTTIQGARINANGVVVTNPFFVGGGQFAGIPCASSPIAGTSRAAIVYQLGIPLPALDSTIMVALVEGSTVLQLANLMTLENSSTANRAQIEPSVDSDGQHFLVSYSEFNTPFGHYEVFVTDLAMSGNTLQVSQNHLGIQPGLGLSQVRSNVAAARATGALAHRYLVVYDFRQNDVDHDVAGRFVEGLAGGPAIPYCFGDTTGITECPCGNFGSDGHGCANSVFASGALLQMAAGQASTLADTAFVQVSSVPPNVSCLFFQGTTAGAGAVFGDGLRCATGTVTRIAATQANAQGIAFYPEEGDVGLSVAGGVPLNGGLRTYQVWYRNAANFCTSATFNLSNGLAIHWAR